MSVLKSKRGESSVQYLETARQLEAYTLRQCMKFPKRLTFFLSTEIVRLSQNVLNHAKAANSIFPANAHEAQMRRDHLIEANNALQALISQIDMAHAHLTDVKDTVWVEWMRLIAEETRTLGAVKRSDQQRFKDLV